MHRGARCCAVSCADYAWAAGASSPARVTGTTSVRSPTPTSTTTPTAPPSSSRPHSMLSMFIDIHTLLAPFVLIPQDARAATGRLAWPAPELVGDDAASEGRTTVSAATGTGEQGGGGADRGVSSCIIQKLSRAVKRHLVLGAARALREADAVVVRVRVDRGAQLCLLYTSPSPRDGLLSRMPSSA